MTRSREILLWVLFLLLAIAFAATVPGCHRMPRFGEKMTGEALGRADARQLYIIEEAKFVQPKDAGKRITIFASDTRKDIEEAAKGSELQAQETQRWQDKYTNLDGKWYVKAGRTIQTVLIVAGIAWTALGLFGAFFVGTPGFVGFLARHVLNLLPFANPYTAIARQRQALK